MKPDKVKRGQRLRSLPWWAVLLIGIAAIILGILLVMSPKDTAVSVMRVGGVVCLAAGAVVLISIPFNRRLWGWKLFAGVLAAVVGWILYRQPLGSAYIVSAIVVWCLGIGAILGGAALIIQGVAYAGWAHTLVGAIALLFGIALIYIAVVGAILVPSLFGIAAVVGGVALILAAFRLRSRPKAVTQLPTPSV